MLDDARIILADSEGLFPYFQGGSSLIQMERARAPSFAYALTRQLTGVLEREEVTHARARERAALADVLDEVSRRIDEVALAYAQVHLMLEMEAHRDPVAYVIPGHESLISFLAVSMDLEEVPGRFSSGGYQKCLDFMSSGSRKLRPYLRKARPKSLVDFVMLDVHEGRQGFLTSVSVVPLAYGIRFLKGGAAKFLPTLAFGSD